MRGRGLKHISILLHDSPHVAPHAGAWIETNIPAGKRPIIFVAPHAGAWIETILTDVFLQGGMSPPMRGRGLKHIPYSQLVFRSFVAPHAGAWIET